MQVLLAVFVVSLSGVLGQQLIPGVNCPAVKPKSSFSLPSFLGRWYEVQRYDVSGEELAECAISNFSPSIKSIYHMTMDNEITWLDNWTRETGNTTTLTYTSTTAPLVATFKPEIGDQPDNLSYNVMLTDYTGYAVVWGCQPSVKPGYRAEYAWVLSRTPALSAPDRAVVDAYLSGATSVIAPVLLRPVRHDDACITPPPCKC